MEVEFFECELVAERVVEVEVCAEQVFDLEIIPFDVVGQLFLLGVVAASAIYDDAFTGVVGDDVGVLVHHVET